MRGRLITAALILALATLGSLSAQGLVEWQGRWVTPARAAELDASLRPDTGAAPSFGTAGTSRVTVGACDATIRNFSFPWQSLNCDFLTPLPSSAPTSTSAGFPVHLPAGALITSVTVNYFDSTTGTNPGMSLFEADTDGNSSVVAAMQIGAFSGGLTSKTVAVDPPHPVDGSKPLIFNVILHSADETHIEGFISAHVDYKLQVSPAPANATFGDVPTSDPIFQFVEALAASGITVGCGGGNFCPNQPLTRGQMAVFLSKALGLHFPN